MGNGKVQTLSSTTTTAAAAATSKLLSGPHFRSDISIFTFHSFVLLACWDQITSFTIRRCKFRFPSYKHVYMLLQ